MRKLILIILFILPVICSAQFYGLNRNYVYADFYAYDNVSFSIGALEPLPQGVWFHPMGDTLFHIGSGNDYIYAHELTTAWDLSTAQAYSSSFRVRTQVSAPQDMVFNNAGDTIWVIGSTNDVIAEYNLTTAWDLSTTSYSGNSLSVTDGYNESLVFNDNGSVLYTAISDSAKVYEWILTNNFDITTASLSDSISFSDDFSKGTSTGIQTIRFNDDGSLFYILGFGNNIWGMRAYSLTTPYNVTTKSLLWVSNDLRDTDDRMYSFYRYEFGNKLYTIGDQFDYIYQFTIKKSQYK